MSFRISYSPNGIVNHLIELTQYGNGRKLEFTIQPLQVRDRPGELEIDQEWKLVLSMKVNKVPKGSNSNNTL